MPPILRIDKLSRPHWSRPYDFVVAVYVFIFCFPLFFGLSASKEYIVSFVALFAAALVFRPRPFGRHRAPNAGAVQGYSRRDVYFFLLIYIVVSFVSLNVFSRVGLQGLIARDVIREGAQNFNAQASDFWRSQFEYAMITVSALLLSRSLVSRSWVLLVWATILSTYILSSTGTRWFWLLAASPLLLQALVSVGFLPGVALATFVAVAMLSISAGRSSVSELDLAEVVRWDIPSFQSLVIIGTSDVDFENFVNFFYGQILVLVPRFFWPSKPLDTATVGYMYSEIGDAFDAGATVLPGFLGSAWLYGGMASVILLSALLFLGVRWLQLVVLHRMSTGPMPVWVPLVYVAFLLQSRGISIFYFVPAFYCVLFSAGLSLFRRLRW